MLYYPFMVDLDRCSKGCNILDDPSGKICVVNKTKDVNKNSFDMITTINK